MDFDNWMILFLALFSLIELIYICYFWTRHKRLLNDLKRAIKHMDWMADRLNAIKQKAARVVKENVELHKRLKSLEHGPSDGLNIKE